MRFDYNNDGRDDFVWSQPSGWKIPTTGDSWALGASFEVGAIGIASISAGLGGGESWIQIGNDHFPNAHGLSMPDGTALPDWPRYYWLVMRTLGPSLGVSVGRAITGKAGVNLDTATESNASQSLLEFIHRWPGAPSGDAQEQGDPIGFLGAALQDGLTGSAAIGYGVTGTACTLALGAMMRGRNGLILATATELARIFTNVVGLDHLAFQYGAALWSTADTFTLGAGIGVNVSFQVAYVPRLHMFVVEPELKVPFYCYTRGVRDDGTITKYTDRDMKTKLTYYDPSVIDDYRAAVRTAREVDRLEAEWDRIKDPYNGIDPSVKLQNLNNQLNADRVLLRRLEQHPTHPLFSELRNRYVYGWGNGQTPLFQRIQQLEDATRSR